ncbi:MBL fold metallo-hydrolase [Kribbella sp. NBC_01505]|uniref:MBL fold metallo-hydrolase n=1 Tax=Kribbella sp. NBC_01505 TaxID=2903580 RepID=UPI0038677665
MNNSVERLLDGLGGRDAVLAARTQRTTATGRRLHPGWGATPEQPELVAEFQFDLTEDLTDPRYELTLTGPTHLVPVELSYTETSDGTTGWLTGVDFMFDPRPVDRAIPAWRVAARQRHLDLTSVLRLARQAIAGPVTSPADGVLVLEESGITLHLADDGTIATVSVIEDHSPKGDSTVEIHFSRYGAVGRLRLPYRMEITVDGVTVHEETRFRMTVDDAEATYAIKEPGAQADAEQLAFARRSTEWIMTYVLSGVRFYFDLQTAPVRTLDVAPGVKVVVGPSHNILVVELPDHIATVDAPMYSRYTSAALDAVRNAFPGKALRYAVATHFHYDHIGGIREFVAEGNVTVVSGTRSVGFFEQILRTDHTITPDRLQQSPVPIDVRGVEDKLVLPMADGGNLEIHRIVTDHSEDTLIAYASGPKVLFVSDLWSATPTMPEPYSYRGRLAVQLVDAVTALGLEVETVATGHNGAGETTTAPYEYLLRVAGVAVPTNG